MIASGSTVHKGMGSLVVGRRTFATSTAITTYPTSTFTTSTAITNATISTITTSASTTKEH